MATASPPRRIDVRSTGGTPLRGLLPLAALLVGWQLLGDDASVSFPPPTTWLTAIEGMYEQGVLMPALGNTLRVFVLSLIAATASGVLIGTAIGTSRSVDRALTPLLDFFRTLPPPAIIPVAGLLLGATLQMSVTVVVLTIVWPILLNTMSATRTIPPVRLEMSRTLGLTLIDRLRKVMLPSLAPGIMIGVRIAVSVSVIVTLLVDILAAGDGAGRLLVERQQTFDAPAVWGLLLIIGAFGYLLNAALGICEQRLFRTWPEGLDR